MYPLGRGMWGPTVRIGHLRDELARLVDLDVLEGWRGPRRGAIARYTLGGRLRGLDGIYVESSTFLPSETDLAFLALARALGRPVLTYVRDAYQLFDEYAPTTLRGRVGSAAFMPMLRALRGVSSQIGVPTAGLGHAIGVPDAVLLPPGAPAPLSVPEADGARDLLFVGDARLPAHGADRLIAAVDLARQRGVDVGLTVVCRPGQEPPHPHPSWVTIQRAEGAAIHALLPEVVATVIPRPRSAYNDLALPIKLFDNLSYGRPLVVTDCTEQARVVADAGAGLVTSDEPSSMAAAIAEVVSVGSVGRAGWAERAHEAARAAAWSHRAERIRDLLLGSS